MTGNNTLAFHPFANRFPLMLGGEFNEFVADIKANGLREPITLYQGKPLDGRNRYRACLRLKIEPRFEEFKGDDAAAIAFVISKNICRRHLKPKERCEAIKQLLKVMPEKSDRQIAEMVKVDNHKVAKIRKEEEATGEVSPVEKRVGADGKARKLPLPPPHKVASKPKPKPAPLRAATTDDKTITMAALKLVIDNELALLRKFACFVINRATGVTVEIKDRDEWKDLRARVKEKMSVEPWGSAS
jgi:ParB-like chromosome segregation protein Spo0J